MSLVEHLRTESSFTVILGQNYAQYIPSTMLFSLTLFFKLYSLNKRQCHLCTIFLNYSFLLEKKSNYY